LLKIRSYTFDISLVLDWFLLTRLIEGSAEDQARWDKIDATADHHMECGAGT